MTSAEIVPLIESEARLRMLTASDLPTTLAWRNHDESRHWFLSTATISLDEHRAWFDRYRQRDDDYVFIVDIDTTPCAQVAIYDISGDTAEFGRLLVDPHARGRGYGHIATSLALRVARDSLGLRRLLLEVKQGNTAALRAYERAGFRATNNSDDGIVRMAVDLT